MRIDIIVPNFDESSEEVILSAWYKKVGDKILKNEVIADAETSTIACGITSSYDCILAKILVKEGEIISQGTKIAIIETDLSSSMSDIKELQEVEEAKKQSKSIESQIKDDQKEQEKEKEQKLVATKADENSWYSLSVHPKKEVKDISENENIDEEEVIVDFSEQTEEKVINILKTAENQAKEEAQELKEEILAEARKQALLQAEELKVQILKEYEEKALKDAGEMHHKIVTGSLLEAESTKEKLIEEAKDKAKKEAEKIKEAIIQNAELEAKIRASDTIKEAVSIAKEQAKRDAELLSREIIEEAINESKTEAKAIKKDIIHSAQKHAVRESENIVKDVIGKAKKKSHLHAEELVESATLLASREAELLREEILITARTEIKDTVNSIFSTIAKEASNEIKLSVHEIVKEAKTESNKHMQQSVDTISDKVKNEADFREKITVDQLEKQAEIAKKLLNISEDEGTPEMYADNWNKPKFFASMDDYNEPIDLLKRRISEKMKDYYDASVISTVSNEVDMTAILALEKIFGKAFSKKHNTRLGFTPFFISACVAALKQYRLFNAHVHNNEIIYKNNFDISIITCGNDGIASPVIRQAEFLSNIKNYVENPGWQILEL